MLTQFPLSERRLLAGFFVLPAAAAALTFILFLAQVGSSFGPFLFPSSGRIAEPVRAATALAVCIGIIAIPVTGVGAVPVVAWLAHRGRLTLRPLLFCGAVLGNSPLAAIVLVVYLVHLPEALSSDVTRYLGGVPGLLRLVAVGVLYGCVCAAVFWLIAVRPADSDHTALFSDR